MYKSCGIDFGTSNSALGLVGDSFNIEMVKVEGDSITIPSALFFPIEKNSTTIFGRAAQKAYVTGHEGRFMRSLKRVLGTSLMKQGTVVSGSTVSFQNIIARFVRNMKLAAEAGGYEVENVIMGRPVHFVDYDHDADDRAESQLREIAKMVGFKNIEFQYEPIAAAFAHEQHLSKEKLSLVVDIGGGTSDFTVIKLSPERKNNSDRTSDILANTGVRIGGNDFDKDLSIKGVMPEFGYETTYGLKNLIVPRVDYHDISEWSKVNFVYTSKVLRNFNEMLKEAHSPETLSRFVNVLEHQLGHHLLNSIEDAKIELTDKEAAAINFEYIEQGFNLLLQRDNFNNSISDNVFKVLTNAKECLSDAGISEEDIELIILTGGSTEIPYIQRVLAEMFPNAELSQDNKLSSVAMGLAYDAKRKFG